MKPSSSTFPYLFKFLAIVLTLLLAACGGGGDGGSNTASYTIAGTVSGLTGTLVLQNNSGDDLILNSNGSLTFSTPVTGGDGYTVSVLTQPAGQS